MSVLLSNAAGAARGARVDPVGTWSCLLYGRSSSVDERFYLRIDAEGTAAIARPSGARTGRWGPRLRWRPTGRSGIGLVDVQTGRELDADLDGASLGGAWSSASLAGGWWCSRAPDRASGESSSARRRPPAADGLLLELVPAVMATPRYPLEAIRAAKEGRVVGCFTVNASGEIVDPELVELSDEIFRKTTLEALSRSRYRGWADERVLRPACRSFTFRLDAVY